MKKVTVIQERIKEKALLDSRVMGLEISSDFVKKKRFKLKKIERLIYVRNIDGIFNKKGKIKHTVEVNIY